MEKKRNFLKPLPLLFYLFVWEGMAYIVDEPLLFPHLLDVIAEIVSLLYEKSFYIYLFNTCQKAILGFLSAFILGSPAGYFSTKSSLFKSFLEIPLMLMKAVPVAAYIIMLYMWLPSKNIPLIIAFIATFPIVFANIENYLLSRDKKIEEMARVFKISKFKKFIYITIPSSMPFTESILKTCLSLSFKASVAAEVITIAAHTVGESFYNAKIYFDMASLIAWTGALILSAFLAEKLLESCLKLLKNKIEEGFKWI